jgi:hypothetical protein
VAILAREIGAPCMIGVSDLRRLRDADVIELRPSERIVIARWNGL